METGIAIFRQGASAPDLISEAELLKAEKTSNLNFDDETSTKPTSDIMDSDALAAEYAAVEAEQDWPQPGAFFAEDTDSVLALAVYIDKYRSIDN